MHESGPDTYRCPAGERFTRRFTSVEAGKTMHTYWANGCQGSA